MSLSWGQLAWPLALGGAAWVGVRFFEWKNLYYPLWKIETTPADFRLQYEDEVFVSEDGNELHGWWIPHPKARGTIIHCHGNAGNIGGRAWMAADLHKLGVNVFLFDYRGYGKSKGLPTEKGTYADARAAFEVVRARHDDADSPPVIIHGQSLGGAIAIQLVLDKPARGLILESTFTSVLDMGKKLYPWLRIGPFIRFRYDSLSKIDKITKPKLICHSPDDKLIPLDMGRALFDRAAEPKEFVELAGSHGEAGWTTTPAYWERLEAFVDQLLGPAPG